MAGKVTAKFDNGRHAAWQGVVERQYEVAVYLQLFPPTFDGLPQLSSCGSDAFLFEKLALKIQ